MAKGASGEEVKAAFQKHLAETETQVERLDQVFELIGDAGLVGAAQAVEHYEIARYGTMVTWAEQLGHSDAAELLKATLAEEEATDEALSALGEGGVNQRAVSAVA
jgi:ferritin-like metal-binding protein YciE